MGETSTARKISSEIGFSTASAFHCARSLALGSPPSVCCPHGPGRCATTSDCGEALQAALETMRSGLAKSLVLRQKCLALRARNTQIAG